MDAATLKDAWLAGYRARLGGRPREPDREDHDEAYAWLAGWVAADDEIFSTWRG